MAKSGIAKNLPTIFNVKGYGAAGDGIISAGAVTGTDDTAAIQAAIDAAALVRGTVYFPPGIYRQDGQLSLLGKSGISMIGASGGVPWTFCPDVEAMGSTIIYTGSGTTPGWDGRSLIGASFYGIDFCYSNPLFTGPLLHFSISGQHPASSCVFRQCRFSSLTNTIYSAKCLLSLQFAISFLIEKCYFYGAQWLVRGVETTGAIGEASNNITLRSNVMQGGKIGFIANPTDWWTVEDNCLEAFPFPDDSVPEYLVGGDVASITSKFSYTRNQHWDCNFEGCIPIKQPSNQTWLATFRENFFDGSFFNSVHMSFQGPGAISITNNIFDAIVNGPAGPTLIDAGPSSTALKEMFICKWNRFYASGNAPSLVTNTSGHTLVDTLDNSSAGHYTGVHIP